MDGLSDTTITELIAINHAKRQLNILPDEWYSVDLSITELGRFDLLPTSEQIEDAISIILEET